MVKEGAEIETLMEGCGKEVKGFKSTSSVVLLPSVCLR